MDWFRYNRGLCHEIVKFSFRIYFIAFTYTEEAVTDRSSRPEVFRKKGFPRKFTKFTGKHRCQSLFFNKVPGLACNFIKKIVSGTGVFL